MAGDYGLCPGCPWWCEFEASCRTYPPGAGVGTLTVTAPDGGTVDPASVQAIVDRFNAAARASGEPGFAWIEDER